MGESGEIQPVDDPRKRKGGIETESEEPKKARVISPTNLGAGDGSNNGAAPTETGEQMDDTVVASVQSPNEDPEVIEQDERFPFIHQYLELQVKPVQLPGNDPYEKPVKKTASEANREALASYPPLILDGASGVGKTQQAFALLKGGGGQDPQRLVYVLLSEAAYEDNTQQIYSDMIDFTIKERDYLEAIDVVLKELEELYGNGTKGDKLSVKRIGRLLLDARKEDYKYQGMKELVRILWTFVIEYQPRGSLGLLNKPNETKQVISYEHQLEDLKDKVLFVDEVLPSPSVRSATSNPTDRLKFLRNFSRATKMRAVLAGTAATAANMWALPKGRDGGGDSIRKRHEKLIWGEVEFLYEKIKTTVDFGKGKKEILVRPLVSKWLSTDTRPAPVADIIDSLVDQSVEKKLIAESKFIWLSGACLLSPENVSSPFLLRPSLLVRKHFFEPALLTYQQDGKERIYEGKGYKIIDRKIGSQRLQIVKYNTDEGLVWFLSRGNQDTPIGIGPQNSFIEYALSHCVQVCLAMEPLFAVVLSIRSKIWNGKDFRNAFRDALPETSLQRTNGHVDGELHEQIIFAALQIACDVTNMKCDTSVKTFVDNLNDLLQIDCDMDKYNRIAGYLRQ